MNLITSIAQHVGAGTVAACMFAACVITANAQTVTNRAALNSNSAPTAVRPDGVVLPVNPNPSASWERVPLPPAPETTNTANRASQVRSGMQKPEQRPPIRPGTAGLNHPAAAAYGNSSNNNAFVTARFQRRTNREAIFAEARAKMVTNQISGAGRGILKPEILNAMRIVPRHEFIPAENAAQSYADKQVDIGYDRVIESPYAVAVTLDQLDLKPSDRVLEIGTGSGYQAAVMGVLAKEVYSLERSKILAERAVADLQRLGITNNVFVRQGDIAAGWEDAAPFDAIIVSTPIEIPDAILAQLREGGRLVIAAVSDGNVRVANKNGNKLVAGATRSVRPLNAYPSDNKTELRPLPKAEIAMPPDNGKRPLQVPVPR